MFKRNVLLHYLNLEYRRIVGIDKFISKEKTKELLHRINYAAILLCNDYCLIPYSALIEDDVVSDLFLSKHYDIFFEVGLIRASSRENSPEEFLDKKIEEYDSSPELYGYYKKNAIKKLKEHDILIIKRDLKIGKAIQEKWNNDLENYATKSVWRDVLKNKEDLKLASQLKEIPNIIIDRGKGIIWPLVSRLLVTEDPIKKNKIREVLHNLYFSNYLDENKIVILTDIPFSISNFSLDNYKGYNYSYNIFYRFLSLLNVFSDIIKLNSSELLNLKMSTEFSMFIEIYHNKFGSCNNYNDSLVEFNGFQDKIDVREILQKTANENGYNKIKYILRLITDKLDKDILLNISEKIIGEKHDNKITSKRFDVAILTALHEHEFEKIETTFGNKWNHDDVSDKTKIYLTTSLDTKAGKISVIGSYQINTGMVEAGIFATEIVNRFKPKFLIMPGVLAGKPQKNTLEKTKINFGDIVVGTKLFIFEKGKYSDEGFEIDLEFVEIDTKLIQQVRLQRKFLLDKVIKDLKILKNNGESCLNEYNIDELNVHIAPIACSFSVINKLGFFEERASKVDRKTTGLEMESYGIARACKLSNNGKTKPLIIKSVMDHSEFKDDKNKELAAITSALFVKHLITDVLDFI